MAEVVLIPCPNCGTELLPQKRDLSKPTTHIQACQITVDFEPKEKLTIICPKCGENFSEYATAVIRNYAHFGRHLFGPTDVYNHLRSYIFQIRVEIDELEGLTLASNYKAVLDKLYGLRTGVAQNYPQVAEYLHLTQGETQRLILYGQSLMKQSARFSRIKATRYQSPESVERIRTLARTALERLEKKTLNSAPQNNG